MPPLVHLLASHPDLVARHLGAYADLVGAEAVEAAEQVRHRLTLVVAVGTSTVLGLGLTALALMLAAVVPMAQMPWPWLLVALPAGFWVVALGCWWRLRQAAPLNSFSTLREQMELDAALLRQVQPS